MNSAEEQHLTNMRQKYHHRVRQQSIQSFKKQKRQQFLYSKQQQKCFQQCFYCINFKNFNFSMNNIWNVGGVYQQKIRQEHLSAWQHFQYQKLCEIHLQSLCYKILEIVNIFPIFIKFYIGPWNSSSIPQNQQQKRIQKLIKLVESDSKFNKNQSSKRFIIQCKLLIQKNVHKIKKSTEFQIQIQI